MLATFENQILCRTEALNKCLILISYICIAAFHLGTIDEPRGWRDDGVEPEDGECGHV